MQHASSCAEPCKKLSNTTGYVRAGSLEVVFLQSHNLSLLYLYSSCRINVRLLEKINTAQPLAWSF